MGGIGIVGVEYLGLGTRGIGRIAREIGRSGAAGRRREGCVDELRTAEQSEAVVRFPEDVVAGEFGSGFVDGCGQFDGTLYGRCGVGRRVFRTLGKGEQQSRGSQKLDESFHDGKLFSVTRKIRLRAARWSWVPWPRILFQSIRLRLSAPGLRNFPPPAETGFCN